jgi:hypothetical protein
MAKSSLVSSPYIAQITERSSGVSINIGRPVVYNSILYRCIQSYTTGIRLVLVALAYFGWNLF